MSDASAGDLGKFCKFFTLRLVQGVVQSRLGQRVRTECDAEASDWFNVRMEELGEVTGEIRAATQGRFPPDLPCLCLDFQLRTSEGELLPLESWAVSFDSEECDPGVGIRAHLYHQLSVLLRSAMATARLTPLYRYYARRQGPDSFIVCYSLHQGPVDTAQLGPGSRSLLLGALPSPLGTLRLHLHFRTSMVISDAGASEPAALAASGPPGEATAPRPVQECGEGPRAAASSESDSSLFALFSTSPPSATEQPWPLMAPQRKGSVTFAHATSDSSNSSKSSHHADQSAQMSKRGSSGALFSLELSGSGSGGRHSLEGADEQTRSSARDADGDEEEEDEEVGGGEFPFAALLSASSAPQMKDLSLKEGGLSPPGSPQKALESPSSPSLLASPSRGVRPSRITEDSREGELEEEGSEDCSDDSFVKVEAGPLFVPQSELGSDLSVLVREWKTAPSHLPSFEAPLHSPRADEAGPSHGRPPHADLAAQLPAFQGLQSSFDSFLQTLQAEDD